MDLGYLTEAMQDIGKISRDPRCYIGKHLSQLSLVRVVGPISQRSFLSGMQIEERTNALAAAAESVERKQDIQNALKRLVDPQGMGTQYKFLGIVSKDLTGDVLLHPFGEVDSR